MSSDLGFRVSDLGFRLRVKDLGFRLLGFRVTNYKACPTATQAKRPYRFTASLLSRSYSRFRV